MGHCSGRWFHHNLNGLEAERLLLQKGVSGSFLARPSHSTTGSFTLSVRRGDEVTHIRIQNTGEYLDLYGGEKFATLSELVTYYMENEGQLKEKNGDLIELKYPLISEDPTTERWFHGRITGKDAEKMLMEKGKYGGFLVRESFHRPGSYVLSVLTGEQVAHIMIHGKPNGMYDVGGGHQFCSLKELIDFYTNTPMVEKNGGLVSLKQPFNATRFNVSTIDQRMRQLEQENGHGSGLAGFLEEFEELQQEADTNSSSRLEGSKIYNRGKNRYKNILPFDHSQVVLRDGDPKEPGSGYINANFICWPSKLTESLFSGTPVAPTSLLPGDLHQRATDPIANAVGSASGALPVGNNSCNSCSGLNTLPPGAANSSAMFFNDKPRYIATQGTVEATQGSFWRMIWQEKSAVIVMITNIKERGRDKCSRYWPTSEEGECVFPVYKSVLRVRLISERKSDNYTLRELQLTRVPTSSVPSADASEGEDLMTGIRHEDADSRLPRPLNRLGDQESVGSSVTTADSDPSERPNGTPDSCESTNSSDPNAEKALTVYHYHFTAWPDHGTPSDPSRVLDFMHDISARQDNIPDSGPIVVHCSAGIGRTGAFIVIDMLINYIKCMGLSCDIDISRTIQAVRLQRSGMVQTETQYRFIYKAVQQYVNTMSKRIQMDNDLRHTGRDYTNINRAADDVGVLGVVGGGKSLGIAAASGAQNSAAPDFHLNSHSPPMLDPPSLPPHHGNNVPADTVDMDRKHLQTSPIVTGRDHVAPAHVPTDPAHTSTTRPATLPPNSPSGPSRWFQRGSRSKARP
ncbi:unnamed protein product [Calicophoron daubneyi]|uniref:protein-tyrosine-phosphatase n=1 Tax=Calicophoron daubneyi TaxID=300641 RepID=A0AAV2T1J6_CALDB